MRIIFIDIHINRSFINDLRDILINGHAIKKFEFLLNWLLDHDIEVVNLITKSGTAIPTCFLKKVTSINALRKIEAKYVLRKNNKMYKKIKNITNPSKINKDDIVICFEHFNIAKDKRLCKTSGIKILDLYHFYGGINLSEYYRKLEFKYYISPVDLSKYSKMFQKNYFWFDGQYIQRNFTFASRFKLIKSYNDRKNKVIAVGTITNFSDEGFMEIYGTECYQPLREMIYIYSHEYPELIDSYISWYMEDSKIEVNTNDLFFVKLQKKIKNYYNIGKQKKYFSFDMVQKFNEYKMFICPEDIHGIYGIGVIEGMACGCAMIGLDYGGYEDMGMKKYVHYIPYNGTIQDLVSIIKHYQKPEFQYELERIALNGYHFVHEHCNQDIVAETFYNDLYKIQNDNI